MKITTTIIIFITASLKIFGQNDTITKYPQNTIFADLNYSKELDLYSILYDRVSRTDKLFKIGFQTGVSVSTKITTGDKNYSRYFPLKIYILVGKHRHNFETGIGTRNLWHLFPEFNMGYRFISYKNGLSLRTGYTAIIFPVGLENMINLSAGYMFKL